MSAAAPHDPAAGPSAGGPADNGPNAQWQTARWQTARWQTARQALARRWAAFAPRERRLLAIGGTVLAAFVVWAVAIAPAWRTLQSAPAQLDALDLQLQRMQGMAAEAATLRAVAPVPAAQAQAALTAATERLGAPGKLSLQGERALLTLKGVSPAQLSAWLAEARVGARARVVEARLNPSGPGLYDGSLTLALGPAR